LGCRHYCLLMLYLQSIYRDMTLPYAIILGSFWVYKFQKQETTFKGSLPNIGVPCARNKKILEVLAARAPKRRGPAVSSLAQTEISIFYIGRRLRLPISLLFGYRSELGLPSGGATNFRLLSHSASCKVFTCASRACAYSRSAASSDCNFLVSPSRRIISSFNLATSPLTGAWVWD
jgi:hypothetical protein